MKKSILTTLIVSAFATGYVNAAANQDSASTKKRVAAVEKEYNQARAKCNRMTGTDKDNCNTEARKWHATAIADARAGRTDATASTAYGATTTAQTAAGTGTPVTKAEALRECEKMTGDSKTACVLERPAAKGTTAQAAGNVADKTQAAAGRAVDKTQAAASNVANRTENAMERGAARADNAIDRAAARTDNAADRAAARTDNAVDRTAANARAAAQRTENATERAVDKTRATASTVADRAENATERAADKTERAAEKAGEVVADSVITTRVKTDLFKEPDLKALAIHVETEKGVVMLSGFVNSKNEATRAVNVAKGVKGVTEVKSALKVK